MFTPDHFPFRFPTCFETRFPLSTPLPPSTLRSLKSPSYRRFLPCFRRLSPFNQLSNFTYEIFLLLPFRFCYTNGRAYNQPFPYVHAVYVIKR
jgi:hypothetical protein